MHDPVASPFAQAALSLIACGYSPVPIGVGTKYPARYELVGSGGGRWWSLKNWQVFCNRQAHPNRITLWSGWPEAGIGLACGFGGVVAVDVDDDLLIEPLLAVLPPVMVGKKGRKGATFFFRATEALPSKNYRTAAKRGLLDFLSDGKQTVLPPSIHPDTGEPYRWTTTRTLVDTPLTDLPAITSADVAAMEEVLRAHGWEDTYRAQAHSAAPDRPVRRQGEFTGDDAASLFREVNDLALASLSAWVPKLGLQRCYRSGGGFKAVAEWRASGSGRPLARRSPNLSFMPQGIRDFGDGRGYSPIDVVMAAHRLSASEALDWLGALVGVQTHDPEAAALAERIVANARKKKAAL